MGNDPDRCTAETHEGELAVDCLACPKPGVNLPKDGNKPLQRNGRSYLLLAEEEAKLFADSLSPYFLPSMHASASSARRY
jgi:hypothetical protein